MSSYESRQTDFSSEEYQIPYLPDYRFRCVCIKKGHASKGQIDQIVKRFFELIGKSCDYEINYIERKNIAISYIWFENVEIAELFQKGDEITISREIDDPNWKPPAIPLIQAKEELMKEVSWDDEDEEMNYEEVLDFSLSDSTSQWGERVDPITLEDRILLLEKSYVRPKIVVQEKISQHLRYKYSPEQLERIRRESYEIGDKRPIGQYGSIAIDTIEAFSAHDAPCVPNVIINSAIPPGTTENDIRRLLGKFATTKTVPIRTRFGMKEVPSPHIHFVPSRDPNGKSKGCIYVTYHPNTHDSHVAWQMRAFVSGYRLECGKTADFAFKRKLVG